MAYNSSVPPLARGAIDRDASTRMSADSLDLAWAEPAARLLELRGGDVPIASGTLELRPVDGARSNGHWYLGRYAGDPVFAVSLHDAENAEVNRVERPGIDWVPARSAGAHLSPDESELLMMAVALQHWHASGTHSPRDGSATLVTQGGWSRVETPSGVEHFPRTDPAVIVLVVHEDRALLGSNVLWEAGRFSLLAGFIEAGESAEQAARREVAEESGVRIDRLEYLGSQPWPFPRSLMLGYFAQLAEGQDPAALAPDPEEIAELRWFSRDELRHPTGGVKLPGAGSIARWIIDEWIAQGDGAGNSQSAAPQPEGAAQAGKLNADAAEGGSVGI